MPFSSLLASRSKTDHAKQLKEYFTVIENEQDKERKNYEDAIKNIHKTLIALKDGLFGPRDGSSEPAISDVSQLCSGIYSQELMTTMINNLSRVTFEDRKEIVAIFNNLLRRQVGAKYPAVDHIMQRPGILFKLIEGYDNADIALNCGMMLRECIRVQELADIILKSPDFYKFFDYVQKSTFDIASDAFATFKDLLTKHKSLCADFLERNYDSFFNRYRDLLNSENYVTRRQSLKILSTIILENANLSILKKFSCEIDKFILIYGLFPSEAFSLNTKSGIMTNPMTTSAFDIYKREVFDLFKLLGELLLDRYNFSVMTKYITNTDNLKQQMNLLKEKSKNIQFEAFHVFKIFVANPTKPKAISDILLRNREKLIDFLTTFHTDRTDDEQFNDEKAYLIKQISELKDTKA
ncbi:unnamed protein product [Rotaria socialis]|uniref:Mo25-like protein n=1 Tax=Rotaria socialis TaxID=392032 RepID=A0A819WF27_9BILA|nr:unnamed protein product [Rotaria socialis]CAF4158572.1 unnamed protein product [Rotaria socialis]CAF4263449.1 unnamed protein product [Rotaria socialis]CAF4491170.1 unnamed protein product [Rotaria socialis]CAF4516469.1 unnamed protein product [Rotaria socialis]